MKKIFLILTVVLAVIGCQERETEFKALEGVWVLDKIEGVAVATQSKSVMEVRGSMLYYGFRVEKGENQAVWHQEKALELNKIGEAISCASVDMEIKIQNVAQDRITYTITRSVSDPSLVNKTCEARKINNLAENLMVGTWENIDNEETTSPYRLVYYTNGIYNFYPYIDGDWSIAKGQKSSLYRMYGGKLLVTCFSLENGDSFCDVWDLTSVSKSKSDAVIDLPTVVFTQGDGQTAVREWKVKKIAKYDLFF